MAACLKASTSSALSPHSWRAAGCAVPPVLPAPAHLRLPLRTNGPFSGRVAPVVQCSAVEDEARCPLVSASAAKPQPEPLWKRLSSTALRAAAVLGVATALALGAVDPALAARTGGRMGGSAGFSRSAASRSYGGSSSSRGSVMTRSTAAPRTSSVYHSTVITAPPVVVGGGFGWGMPMFSPFGYGFGGPMVVAGGGMFSSLISIMMMFTLAAVAVQVFRGFAARSGDAAYEEDYDAAPPVTVAKVQVALLANARGLKRNLDELALSANTSSPDGLHMMLQEAVLALLRYPEYCVSAYANSKTLADENRAEGLFNGWSLEERSKVKEETLVNERGRALRNNRAVQDSREVSEFIVVTLTVAAEGTFNLPVVRTPADLRTALSKLGAVAPHQIMAAEITWAPQADGDTLTHQDLLTQYPDLAPL